MMEEGGGKGMTRKQFLLGAAAAVSAGAAIPATAAEEARAPAVAPPGETGARTRLILLGTAGGPNIRKYRSQPSSLLVVDGAPYLFDAGYGCLHQLVCAGFAPRDIAALFVTHLHTDHSIDIASILNFCWSGGRTAELPIVGPPGIERLTALGQDYVIEALHVFVEQFPAHPPATFARPRDIRAPGLVYSDGRIKVFAAENSHFQTFSHGADRSYSYRIECPDRVICVVGDSGPSEAIADLARGADILLSEVIDPDAATAMAMRINHVPPNGAKIFADHMAREHMPSEDLGRIAAAAGVKMVVLTHVVPGEDGETDMSRYTAGVRRHFGGAVIAGQDLLKI